MGNLAQRYLNYLYLQDVDKSYDLTMILCILYRPSMPISGDFYLKGSPFLAPATICLVRHNIRKLF